MVIDKEVSVKDNISLGNVTNVIDIIVDMIISKGDDGEIAYTPYYRGIGYMFGVVSEFLNGVSFSDDDSILDIYNTITNNEVIQKAINEFSEQHKDHFNFINDCVDEIVDFRKQQYIHSYDNELIKRIQIAADKEIALNEAAQKLAETQSKQLERQMKLQDFEEQVLEEMSPKEIAELNRKVVNGDLDVRKIIEDTMKEYTTTKRTTTKRKQAAK